MKYLSVSSGIGVDHLAWHGLSWECVGFGEIAPFPSAVLAHHWPHIPNYGDFTRINRPGGPDVGTVDLLAGGTPCQAFSVAGKRGGLDDPRGELSLEFVALARRVGARWVAWENVPGVLSSNGGRDFGAFLGALAECGYGFAYRILDAQHFGVPQRRRRVFVVGYLGDWRRAAAVLFERHSLSGHPPPRRDAGAGVAGSLTASAGRRCGVPDAGDTPGHLIPMAFGGNDTRGALSVAPALLAHSSWRGDFESEAFVAQPVPLHLAQLTHPENRSNPAPGDPAGTLNGSARAAIAFSYKDYGADAGDVFPTLRAAGHDRSHANGGAPPAVAFHMTQDPISGPVSPALGRTSHGMGAMQGAAVRRLTPVECERLQGLPDDHTRIPWRGKPATDCPDGPRYKAIGNAWALPVARWIGERIALVETLTTSELQWESIDPIDPTTIRSSASSPSSAPTPRPPAG